MIRHKTTVGVVGTVAALLCVGGCERDSKPAEGSAKPQTSQSKAGGGEKPAAAPAVDAGHEATAHLASFDGLSKLPETKAMAPFVKKGVDWLAKAQHEDGGWGAGSHANQKNRNPHAVKTDPATTAFTALALIRAGHTPSKGAYRKSVLRATEHLVRTVESAPKKGPKITTLTGTQPQNKLGAFIDTAMTTQFLSRVLPLLEKDGKLHGRVSAALDTCLAKLESMQNDDGSVKGGTWAGVLQSSLASNALEVAEVAGKRIDRKKLDSARFYLNRNFKTGEPTEVAFADAVLPVGGIEGAPSAGGTAVPRPVIASVASAPGETRLGAEASVSTKDSAGVALYAYSGAQRATANEARAAMILIDGAKQRGDLASEDEINLTNLRKIGLSPEKAAQLNTAWSINAVANRQIDNEQLLAGFGNNGGEEYLSYMLTSESLVISGGKAWDKWNDKMHKRLAKIQSQNGSWTGQHCLTSPVFCTAAVVQCLTADRDAAFLTKIAGADVKDALADTVAK